VEWEKKDGHANELAKILSLKKGGAKKWIRRLEKKFRNIVSILMSM